MQGLNISFGTPKGVESLFLAPKQEVKVPDNWTSRIVENLVHRRMVKITNVVEPVYGATETPVKKTRKTYKSD
jgi:hypothetical protein